jgi:hypothetical protein
MISAESDRKSCAVTMPTNRSFSITGKHPIFRLRIIPKASRMGVSGAIEVNKQ